MDSHFQSPQEAFHLLAEVAAAGSNHETVAAYEKLLGIELNPYNVVMLKTIPIAFIAQFVLFYATWYFAPSFRTTNRRGLAWSLSFYCSCFMFSLSLFEVGQLRLTIFDHLGLDSTSLGLPPSATVFSHWTPTLYRWVMGLGSSPNSHHMAFVSSWIGDALRWFVAQPVFSLAPLQPVLGASAYRPFFLGGGGRFLISLENLPRDSMITSLIAGYFVGYALGDQVLSFAHYREYVGFLTGDLHHTFYSIVVFSMCRAGAVSIFSLFGGASEGSTMILCWGYMFPKRKSDFWFAVSFFWTRIMLNLGGLHELLFNVGPTGGAAYVYIAALVMHTFWFSKFIRIQVYKAKKRAKEQLEETQKRQQEGDLKSLALSESTEKSGRIKAGNGSVILLRASASKKDQ